MGTGELENQVTYSVICLQVINLLLKHDGPEVLTDELDHVELIREARPVTREPLTQALADTEAQPFQAHVDAVPEDLCLRQAVRRQRRHSRRVVRAASCRGWTTSAGAARIVIARRCRRVPAPRGRPRIRAARAHARSVACGSCATRSSRSSSVSQAFEASSSCCCGCSAPIRYARGCGGSWRSRGTIEGRFIRPRHALRQRDQLDQQQVEAGYVEQWRVCVSRRVVACGCHCSFV